jgi:hypothetical protein
MCVCYPATTYGVDGGHGGGSSTMKRVTICAFVPSHQEHTVDYYNNMIFLHHRH